MPQSETTATTVSSHEHCAMPWCLVRALSHEIHSPLRAIALHLDLIEEELLQPVADHRFCIATSLGAIKTELARIGSLMQDYLLVAQLASLHCPSTDSASPP